jgi:hypothetical protein
MKKSMLLVTLAFSMFGSTALAEEGVCRGKAQQTQEASSRQEAPVKEEASQPDFSVAQEQPQAEYCVPSNCSQNSDCRKGWYCNQKCCTPR